MERLKILVVDDEPGMQQAIHRALADYTVHLIDPDTSVGFTIAESGCGEDALTAIRSSTPDILVLDYKLGRISGMDVLQHILETGGNIIAIMITAYASYETALTAAKLGAYDFLAKPFTPDELKTAIYRATKYRMLQRQAQQLIREKHRFRFDLISMVSHELKSPLAAVESFLGIMRNRNLGEDIGRYEHVIERSIARLQGMRKLIMDLLDLSRIESGQIRRCPETLDLVQVAESAVQSALPDARRQRITIRIHGKTPVRVTADRKEMDIVFNNLIGNGIKYNRKGGSVDVTVASQGSGSVVTVSDTGIGMSADESARIFNDFVRIRNPKTEGISGSGLGLSIVKKIVGLYGGNVSVTGRPEAGSVFTVTLPAASGAPPSVDAEGRKPG